MYQLCVIVLVVCTIYMFSLYVYVLGICNTCMY